jgi:hypothetical protein
MSLTFPLASKVSPGKLVSNTGAAVIQSSLQGVYAKKYLPRRPQRAQCDQMLLETKKTHGVLRIPDTRTSNQF